MDANLTHSYFGNLPSSVAAAAAGLRSWPARFNDCAYPAAGAEITFDDRPLRFRRFDHVFQDLIDDVLLKNAQITIAVQILLHRLQLQTVLLRHISDRDHAKIGKAGLGTHRGKFRHVYNNLIGRKLVWPGLNVGKIEIQARFGVRLCVTS